MVAKVSQMNSIWISRHIRLGLALLSLALAQVTALAFFSASALTPRGKALVLASAMVVAGLALDSSQLTASKAPPAQAVAWAATLALGAVAFILMSDLRVIAPSTAIGLAVGVGVLVFVLCGLSRLLTVLTGRAEWGRLGTYAALALTASAPVWLGPATERLGAGPGLVDAVVGVSPLSYLAAMAEYDYLRSSWFYAHSPIGSLRFEYPGRLVGSMAYLSIGMLCLGLASRRRG